MIILKVLLILKSPNASLRRAAIHALSTCIVSDPSLLQHDDTKNHRGTSVPKYCYTSGISIISALIQLRNDSVPRVREQVVGVIECCWKRAVEQLKDPRLISLLICAISIESTTHGLNADTVQPPAVQLPTDEQIVSLLKKLVPPDHGTSTYCFSPLRSKLLLVN